jgi:CubicO group peptidase (beta-lactamase class C family)
MQFDQDMLDLTPTLHPIAPSEAGFDPRGLAHVDKVLRSGLDVVFPAAVLLVARHGGVAFHRAYGYLDPETRRRPTQTDSLFDLASLTKLFTVTAFMTLVEANLVALDTPVAAVLPEFDGTRAIGPTEDPLTKALVPADPAFARHKINARQITFWHLLTHTSGLAAWRSLYLENDDGEEDHDVPLPHRISVEQRARRLAAIHRLYGFAYPPEQRMVYSDLGIILLGEAVARVTEMPLENYVHQAVLEPLNLKRTIYNPLAWNSASQHTIPLQENLASLAAPVSGALRGDSAEPSPRGRGSERLYFPIQERIAPTEFCAWRQRRCIGEVHDENAAGLGGVAGHAGLFSTAWEVAVLGQTYLNGGSYGGARILSSETVAEMTRVQVDFGDNPRGLGWLQRSQEGSSSGRRFGPRSYGHTGFTGTSLWVDPDRALVVVLLTNRVYYGRDPTGIVDLRPRLHDAVVEAISE